MTKWVVLGLAFIAVLAILVSAVPRRRVGAELLYADLIPAWQTQRFRVPDQADGMAARAMLRAARAWPRVVVALRELDQSYPSEVSLRAARINQAAREAGVPFWLDVQDVQDKPILLSYRIEGQRTWQSEDRVVETLRLRRADRLNVELGLLGQASPNGPLVFVDRIEDDWVTQLAQTPKPEARVEAGVADLFVTVAGQLEPGLVPAMVSNLRERRARFDSMKDRMHVAVTDPSGLVWSRDWFAALEPFTRFANGRGPLIFDTDLRALRESNQGLDRPDFRAAMVALVNLWAENVEVHEARHAIDPPSSPLAWFLRNFGKPEFAALISRELRAYLGELHDAPNPCLSLLGLVRAAYFSRPRPTPHFFAGRSIIRALSVGAAAGLAPDRKHPDTLGPLDASFPEANPIALLQRHCGDEAGSIRAQAADLWRAFFNEDLPRLVRAR